MSKNQRVFHALFGLTVLVSVVYSAWRLFDDNSEKKVFCGAENAIYNKKKELFFVNKAQTFITEGTQSAENVFEGKYSVKTPKNKIGIKYLMTWYPGKNYRLSVWKSPVEANVKLIVRSFHHTTFVADSFQVVETKKNWQKLQLDFQMPKEIAINDTIDLAKRNFELLCKNVDTAPIFFDNFEVKKVE